VLDNVARGSEVRTDGWQGYFDIGRYRFSHVVMNVSASGDPALWLYPTCIWCPRCFNGGSLAPTRVRSAMRSLTTTWTSSPFASTAAAHATAACSSTDCSREHSPPARTHTQRSSRDVARPETFSLQSIPIGGARWIASCAERRVGTGHGMRLPVPGNAYAAMIQRSRARRELRARYRVEACASDSRAEIANPVAHATPALPESTRPDLSDPHPFLACAPAQIRARGLAPMRARRRFCLSVQSGDGDPLR